MPSARGSRLPRWWNSRLVLTKRAILSGPALWSATGVHVVYGLPGLKVHCKTALVVRREGDAIRRYVHLSTGNYNSVTAQLYTDIGMFTCDEAIARTVPICLIT